MQAGLNLFSIKNKIQTEEDFLATAKEVKKMGYSYLQFSGAPNISYKTVKKVVDESGLKVYLTHSPMDRILNDTDNLMEEHAYFGCKNIGLGMIPKAIMSDEKAVKAKIEELNKVAEKMAKNGFKFFYHHHQLEFIKYNGQTVFDYMIKNAPYFNFTVDTYWLQYGGVDILSFLEKLKGRIDCVHLKDYKIEGEDFLPVFAPVGEGNIDFKKVVKKADEMGAKYYFVEQDNASAIPDGMDCIARSIRYINKEL